MKDKALRRYAIKLKKGTYLEIALFESEEPEKGSFISLSVVKKINGKIINEGVYLNKPQASLLSDIIKMLLFLGSELDYEKLKEKYPEQKSWHIH